MATLISNFQLPIMGAPLNPRQPDLSTAVQMLRWLDDEHRKDKIAMAEMQKRLDKLSDKEKG